jgi:hypothetical protein
MENAKEAPQKYKRNPIDFTYLSQVKPVKSASTPKNPPLIPATPPIPQFKKRPYDNIQVFSLENFKKKPAAKLTQEV